MEQGRKAKRGFTPEQRYDILQMIDLDIKSGLSRAAALEKAGIGSSLYSQWKRKLAVGVKSSLRSGKPPVDREKKHLQKEIDKLKAIVLSQAQAIADLKKETNWE